MSKRSKEKNTFVRFIDKNEELCEKYEQVVGEDLWSLPIQKIDEITTAIASKVKMGFNSILYNCVNTSVQTRTPLLKTLQNFVLSDNTSVSSDGLIQKYFKEINQIYTKNNNNYDIEFCEANRDKIISMNLKSVISIAKCFHGLGVPFEDLISAGNVGLVHAFDKYDPKRARLKENMIEAANLQLADKGNTYDDLCKLANDYFKYGKTLKIEFDKKFKKDLLYKKSDMIKWIESNINNAKFNSVACKWIKAYIIQEINDNSRMVKKPKSEIDREKLETGKYSKEEIVSFEDPISNKEKSKTVEETLAAEETPELRSVENNENYRAFKDCLNLLLTGVKSRDRRIMLKKYGIGMIRPLQPNEIAAQEELSVARISQIINSTLETMTENAKKYKDQFNEDAVFEALSRLV